MVERHVRMRALSKTWEEVNYFVSLITDHLSVCLSLTCLLHTVGRAEVRKEDLLETDYTKARLVIQSFMGECLWGIEEGEMRRRVEARHSIWKVHQAAIFFNPLAERPLVHWVRGSGWYVNFNLLAALLVARSLAQPSFGHPVSLGSAWDQPVYPTIWSPKEVAQMKIWRTTVSLSLPWVELPFN